MPIDPATPDPARSAPPADPPVVPIQRRSAVPRDDRDLDNDLDEFRNEHRGNPLASRLSTVTEQRRQEREKARDAEHAANEARAELAKRAAEFAKQQKAIEDRAAELAAEQKRIADERKGWDGERQTWAQQQTAWQDERAMAALGLTDPEGQELARLAYGRIPEAERPKDGIAGWLKAREKVPKGVVAYLPAAEPTAEEKAKADADAKVKADADAKAGRTKAPPNPNAGARSPAGTPPSVSRGTLSQAGNDVTQEQIDAYYSELGVKPPIRPRGLAPVRRE